MEWFARLWSKAFRPGSTAGLIVMAGIVGAGVGVMTVLLVLGIEGVGEVTGWAADNLPIEWLWMFITVPLGLLAAWLIARRFAPEAAGDGVPEVIADLTVRGGYVRTRVMWIKTIATSLTLGAGGSAGREGPIVQIGSSVGASFGRWAHLGEDQIRSLVAAGAGAGIGASFNAPIAGMLFAMEVILGGFAVRHLNTVVVASVTAAVVSRSLIGEELTFPAVRYAVAHPTELLVYAALGILAVATGWLFLRLLSGFEGFSAGMRKLPRWVTPAVFGLVVAALGLASVSLHDGFDLSNPPVLGTGQDFVSIILRGGTFAWWVFLGLLVLKVVATSATLGSKASGGAFAPSLFIGAMLGAGFASLLAPLWTISELQTGAFALVGMSAVFASVARAPLTAILIVFELTRDYGLVLPLMLATALATLLTDLLHRDSVYTMALHRMGVRLPRRSEVDLLDTVHVQDVISPVPQIVEPSMSLAEAQEAMDSSRHHGLPVVEDGRLIGIISVTDVLRAGGPNADIAARDAMTPDPTTVTPSQPVSHALERMAALGVGRLPVVAEHEATRLLGMFRREDAVRAYHLALGTATAAEGTRERLRIRTRPGTRFSEFQIRPGSPADGRHLSEVAWPDGLTIVSIHREREVLVPSGHTLLRSGDRLIAFGSEAAEDQLEARLAPGRGWEEVPGS
ncbi:MAG: chloride channel protein [Acidimicrobiia bacterium]